MKTTSLLLCALLLSLAVKADFSKGYSVTPPAPGVYQKIAPEEGGPTLGNWYGYAGAGEARFDTTLAPASIAVIVDEVPAYSWSGFLQKTAPVDGTVFFTYEISGTNDGFFSWYYYVGGDRIETDITASTTAPTFVSFPIGAGADFGVGVAAQAGGSRNVVISGFNFVTNTTAPLLNVVFTTTNTVIISWPSSLSQWKLQENTNIGTTNWFFPTEPNDNGVIRWLPVPAVSSGFFRLVQ